MWHIANVRWQIFVSFFSDRQHFFLTTFLQTALLCCWGLSFFCPILPLSAQSKTVWIDRLSAAQGLSNNTITAFLQDEKGFLWVGTEDGLNRWDGKKFQVFKTKEGLADNHVQALALLADGRLLIGTKKGGFQIYDPKKLQFKTFSHQKGIANGLSDNNVRAFAQDSKGRIWIATQNGLNLYDPKSEAFQHFFHQENDQNTISANEISALAFDAEGWLWIGTNQNGLDRYNPESGAFAHYRPALYGQADAPDSEHITQLVCTPQAVWVGTAYGGLSRFDMKHKRFGEQGDFEKILAPFKSQTITQLFEASPFLAIGTAEKGLWLYNHQTQKLTQVIQQSAQQNYSLDNEKITALYKDRTGTWWVGLFAEGISKFNPLREKFKTYRQNPDDAQSLPDNRVTSICQDDDALWVATLNGGVSILPLENAEAGHFINFADRSTYGKPQSDEARQQEGKKVWKIYQDSKGNLWLGTSAGLEKYNYLKKVFERINNSDTLSIKDLVEDSEGTLWLATYKNGLIGYNPNQKTTRAYTHNPSQNNSISHNHVRCLLLDELGNLWVGTDYGLNFFDKAQERFTRYFHDANQSSSLSNNDILTLSKDDKGQLWIGTAHGLNLFDETKGEFVSYLENENLPNATINGILTDRYNRLWLSTNQGLSCFDPSRQTFQHYDQHDGLQPNEFIPNAAHQNEKGEMFFGGIGGLNFFHPDSLLHNRQIPPIVITDFLLFNQSLNGTKKSDWLAQSITYTQKIELPQEEARVFSIEFAALDFTLPERNQYAYKLEGFDTEWQYTDANRNVVTYTNLPAREYVFLVKAANADGTWNETPTQLVIVLTPPFWQLRWVQILALVSFLAIAYGGYRLRVYRIEQQKMRLERLIEERTDELAQSNRLLAAQKDDILQKNNVLENQALEIKQQRDQISSQNEILQEANSAIQQAYENIKILSKAGQRITAILDLNELITTVYELISAIVPTEGFGLGLYNENLGRLEFSHFVEKGVVLPFHSEHLREEHLLSVICFSKNQEIFINDLDHEYQNYSPLKPESKAGELARAFLYVPLISEGHTIGVITVQSFRPQVYTPEHQAILRSMATYTSIALSNAKAFRTIEVKNRNITDSIRYALTIQQAMLPSAERIKQVFAEHFVLFKPQAIVSGDFYWLEEVEGKIFVALVDCTGHGVPGGFMSMVGKSLLSEIVVARKVYAPAQILEELHQRTRESLRQDQSANDDGMDIALCLLEKSATSGYWKLTFAGAKRPLYYVQRQENKKPSELVLEELKGDRRSIGGRKRLENNPFHNQELLLPAHTQLYLCSDGFADQTNTSRQKIGSWKLKQLLAAHAHLPLEVQRLKLVHQLEQHQGEATQLDDITVLGLKLPS